MGMKKRDGGSAFPVPDREVSQGAVTLPDGSVVQLHDDGMTLRQYYAAEAMKALIGKIPLYDVEGQLGVFCLPEEIDKVGAEVADSAFAYADDMLAHEEGED